MAAKHVAMVAHPVSIFSAKQIPPLTAAIAPSTQAGHNGIGSFMP
jgi:hypothetical protein